MSTANRTLQRGAAQQGQSPPTIAVMVDWYLPGFKAGGPIRTISNLIERLSGQFTFVVVTRDRDIGDTSPYSGVSSGAVVRHAHSRVFYLSSSAFLPLAVLRCLSRLRYDVLYCNSFFSAGFSIVPVWARWLRVLPKTPLVLAPRGELGPGALAGNRGIKRSLLHISRLCGVYSDALWQATDEAEAAQIRMWFGQAARVAVVPNIGGTGFDASPHPRRKLPGELRLIFVGRISRMKNLLGALEILKQHSGAVIYDVYGPIEDRAYFNRCRQMVEELPGNIRVTFHGAIAHSRIARVMREYDLLFLPTLGENFGHVILEALSGGLPVVVSDRTPWRNLETRNAGWDLPLDQPAAFVRVLAQCAAMDEESFGRLRNGALTIGRAAAQDPEVVQRSATLFWKALGEHGNRRFP